MIPGIFVSKGASNTHKEDAIMKPFRVMLIVSALAALGGCMAVPFNPGYDAGPPGYAAPVYYGPSIGFGIYGGARGYGRGYRYR